MCVSNRTDNWWLVLLRNLKDGRAAEAIVVSKHVLLLTRARTVIWVSLKPCHGDHPVTIATLIEPSSFGFRWIVKPVGAPRCFKRVGISKVSFMIGALSIGVSVRHLVPVEVSSASAFEYHRVLIKGPGLVPGLLTRIKQETHCQYQL